MALTVNTGVESHPTIDVLCINAERGTVDFSFMGAGSTGVNMMAHPLSVETDGEKTLNQILAEIAAASVADIVTDAE